MINIDNKKIRWIYPLRRKIFYGLFGFFGLVLLATMAFIAVMLRDSLIKENALKTEELGEAIKSGIGALMLKRDPDFVQETLRSVGASGDSIVKAFIINREGRVVYSTDTSQIGAVIDKLKDASCRDCHVNLYSSPPETTSITVSDGVKVHRNVKVIRNEEACQRCHDKSERINGKIIIDRSLRRTNSLILFVDLVIFGSGILALALVFPFLSRGVNRYMAEIIRQNSELMLMYMMVERLSKTLDMAELKDIITDIVKDTFDADEVDLVLQKEGGGVQCYWLDSKSRRLLRKKPEDDPPLHAALQDWLKLRINEAKFSADGRTIFMPIEKMQKRLGLIVARRQGKPFEPYGLELTKLISGHVATALENAMLYVISITDELTRLRTYRHFLYCLDKQYYRFDSQAEPFALLMADLDDFKAVNDLHGHVAGDAVLREVAECILYSVRDNDMVFRYGGEEFAVLLPSTGPSGGLFVAERIRKNVEASTFARGTYNLKVTISIGVAACPESSREVKKLIMQADKALYHAKKKGKNAASLDIEV